MPPGKFFSPKTTLEMDGLYTQEDIDNRHYVMGQCTQCKQWSKWDKRAGRWQCEYDRSYDYDIHGSRSIRTWMATKGVKEPKSRRKVDLS